MTETAKEATERLARTLRTEADDLEARHREQFHDLRQAMPTDRDYQRGKMDGLRESARLLEG